MAKQRVFSGSPWETKVGYCRAIRAGSRVLVSGTTAKDEVGAYAQARRCLELIEWALIEAGSGLKDVVRTRLFVTDISLWEEFARAHREVFADLPPATTMVEVRALIDPQMLVEIEAEAECQAP